MAMVKGTTQKKRKHEPNESTRNMPLELSKALSSLIRRRQTDSIMDEVNVLIANYTEKDLEEAVLMKDDHGWLPIHVACMCNVPLEVIQMFLESDVENKEGPMWTTAHPLCLSMEYTCRGNSIVARKRR
jgi:hypothetical protein